MVKREVLFCMTLILVGTVDWLTTIVGMVFFGATETNPLFAGLTRSNMLIFSIVKLLAVMLAGLVFYIAETKTKISDQVSPFAKKLLNSGYVISIFTLTAVVANNITAIVKIA
ncbi:MAG: DUF5658 family protein [Candidatus Bathyarchaeia archaeon]|jgi:hypothetical protein